MIRFHISSVELHVADESMPVYPAPIGLLVMFIPFSRSSVSLVCATLVKYCISYMIFENIFVQ